MKKERTQITQELCDHVKILLAGGANLNKAAEITKTGHATISRIKAAGFDAEVYRQNTLKAREKAAKAVPKIELTIKSEDLMDRQIAMDLTEADTPKPVSNEQTQMNEQVKMMRFQAAQVDKLVLKLDHINDTLCQILRAIRKE